MFSITAIIGPAAWQLLFKTEETFDAACKIFAERSAEYTVVEDDYGHRLDVRTSGIHGYMAEDLNKTKLAHVERAAHQQRTQIELQRRLESDPTLRQMRGPAVLTPMNMVPPAPGFNGR